MQRVGRRLIPVLLAVLSGCTVSSAQPDLWGQDVRLTVFHTADIHSRLLPYDITVDTTDRGLGLSPEAYPYGGAARLRALYLREKAKTDRSVLLDSGDCFEGAPIFNTGNGTAEFQFMSLLHPDASTVGNHEFDHGALNFAEQAKMWVDYPLIIANYQWADWRDPTQTMLGEITRPFTIVNVRGLRVGVIGLGNLDALTSIFQGGNALGTTALEENEVVRQWIGVIAPLTDMIVIVSHMGLTADQALVTGYNDVYPYSSAKPFLACDPAHPECTEASGCCRDANDNPWMIANVLPPRNKSEYDDSCQLKPGEQLLSDGSCPADDTVDVAKLNPNRRVNVFIAPVQNIDLIMGGHIHIVLNPTAVLTEMVVKQEGALRTDPDERRKPDGSCLNEDLAVAGPGGTSVCCPLSALAYYTDPKGEQSGCYSGGIWPDGTYHRNRDGSDVFGAVPNTDTWNGQPRQVLIQHSGAFAKYLGRLDLVVRMPPGGAAQAADGGMDEKTYEMRQAVGGEIVAHQYAPLPIDSLWCIDPRPVRDPYSPTFSQYQALVASARTECAQQEDLETLQLLEPWTEGTNEEFELPRTFAYTPTEILRFSHGSGEESTLSQFSTLAGSVGVDSQLGDAMAESMRSYPGVNAEWSFTNTLGLRDNIYAGPIELEQLFNVFPFEDFLTIQYLSGHEIQDLLDFATDVSAQRGCMAEAQVAGLQYVQDCGRSIHNMAPSCDERLPNGDRPEPCVPSCRQTSDCVNAPQVYPDSPSAAWYGQTCSGHETAASPSGTGCECVQGSCYAWTAHDIKVNGEDLNLSAEYKGCVNDYIAHGGSGFYVLQNNTNKTFTTVSLRDALIAYLRDGFCHCDRILAGDPACARYRENGRLIIDPAAITYCQNAEAFKSYLNQVVTDYPGATLEQVLAEHPERMVAAPNGVWAGQCECRQVLAAQQDPDPNCGHVTPQIREFCKDPTLYSIVTTQEDGRIVESTNAD